MKRYLTLAAGAALALSGMIVAAPQAAADVMCNGSIGASRHDDDIVVRSGATCTLDGTRIDGNIKVSSGGALVATGIVVDGDIQSDGHRSVSVSRSTIDGNVQLSSGGAIALSGNRVAGDIQLFGNSSGTKTVTGNTVDGNLQCKSNTPAPTGGSNTVRGNKEDQCRNLTSGGGASTPDGNFRDGGSVDIYITAGDWAKNGRHWKTSCEGYSSTIERCTTTIWASTNAPVRGGYATTTGWTFNNLTYKASPRAQWKNNPLGGYGKYNGDARWTSDGRQWRTECDTAVTGNGGCRSYVRASVIERTGNTFRVVDKEVFNNMVRFSS